MLANLRNKDMQLGCGSPVPSKRLLTAATESSQPLDINIKDACIEKQQGTSQNFYASSRFPENSQHKIVMLYVGFIYISNIK